MLPLTSPSLFDKDMFDSFCREVEKEIRMEEEEKLIGMGKDGAKMEDEDEDEDEDEEEGEKRRRRAVSEYASTIVHIQRMNNNSATLIKGDKYDKAIQKLGKALDILLAIDDITIKYYHSCACPCYNCSLDGCIKHSSAEQKKLKLYLSKLEMKVGISNIKKWKSNKKTKKEEHFHETPIRVPKRSIRENHNMGSALFLILKFNLALAHHLKVLKSKNENNSKKSSFSTTDSSISMKNAFRLYETLSNNSTKTTSERFNKIVSNNLNHLLKNRYHHVVVAANKEMEVTKKKNDPMEVIAVENLSLYEQHKKLLQNRYATSPAEGGASSSLTLTTAKTQSSSSLSSSNSSMKVDEDGFSSRLQNAMRRSSSFRHLQQERNVCSAYAA